VNSGNIAAVQIESTAHNCGSRIVWSREADGWALDELATAQYRDVFAIGFDLCELRSLGG
jgi:hypothetical protein